MVTEVLQFHPRMLPGRGELSLSANAVDVWLARLDLDRDLSPRRLAVLSTEERQRAVGMATEPRRRFLAARSVLRALIASYLATEPGRLEFSCSGKGKPRLAGPYTGQRLHFNLSHSGDRALFAFGRSPLGVDVERVRPLRDPQGLARRVLATTERRELEAMPAPARHQAFFAWWTLKEAYVKAVGTGIGLPLRSIAVTMAPGSEPVLLRKRGQRDPDWTLACLEPQDGLAGALAIRQPHCSLRCWLLRSPDRRGPYPAISSMNLVS